MLLYKKIIFTLIFICSFTAFFLNVNAQNNTIVIPNLVTAVNPFIGTGGHGHTYPGATLPFGMVQLSPDTRLDGWDGCSGYHYSDSILYGFTHTHLSGTGCSDYGDILLLPTNSFKSIQALQKGVAFKHNTETAYPGYYKVKLEQSNVLAELTATLRTGVHQYTFAAGDSQYVFLNLQHRDEVLDSEIEILYPNKIKGYRFSKAWASNQKVFFEITFSKPFIDVAFYNDDSLTKKPYQQGKNLKGIFAFGNNNKPLLVTVAISSVDNNGAAKNAIAENKDTTFNNYVKSAYNIWQKQLQKIIPTNILSIDDSLKFYTSLYHCSIQPNIYNDVDGKYRGRDNKIYNTDKKFNYYTVFSLWDTYRAWHPLMTMIDEPLVNDIINTFLKQYEQTKLLPIWELSSNETDCMIGYHAASVIWDAYSKGIKKYNALQALEACVAMANREVINSYKTYGYLPAEDDAENVSKTLEYAYDDWCIAQLANALLPIYTTTKLNKIKDVDSLVLIINSLDSTSVVFKDSIARLIDNGNKSIAKLDNTLTYLAKTTTTFLQRSTYWQNILDTSNNFMRAKINSTWLIPFDPYRVDNNYTEANSWQYSFYVPHQIPEFINTVGGKNKYTTMLNNLFTAKEKLAGRQQSDITGLIGQYAHGNEPSHHIAYLYNYSNTPEKSITLVNKICTELYTPAPDGLCGNEDCGQMSAWYIMSKIGLYPIAPGSGILEYNSNNYNNWLIDKSKAPSFWKKFSIENNKGVYYKNILPIANYKKYNVPFITNANMVFADSQTISIKNNNGYPIYYAMDSSKQYNLFTTPLIINKKCSIQFFNANSTDTSLTQEAKFYKLPTDKSVMLNTTYLASYTAGGANGLIDGLHGSTNWRKGFWQGYQNTNLDAIVYIKENNTTSSIKITFLQDQRSWIFYPNKVQVLGSLDGINFKPIAEDYIFTNAQSSVTEINTININYIKANYKAIKVIAVDPGKLPSWHLSAGEDAILFVDEIEIN